MTLKITVIHYLHNQQILHPLPSSPYCVVCTCRQWDPLSSKKTMHKLCELSICYSTEKSIKKERKQNNSYYNYDFFFHHYVFHIIYCRPRWMSAEIFTPVCHGLSQIKNSLFSFRQQETKCFRHTWFSQLLLTSNQPNNNKTVICISQMRNYRLRILK